MSCGVTSWLMSRIETGPAIDAMTDLTTPTELVDVAVVGEERDRVVAQSDYPASVYRCAR